MIDTWVSEYERIRGLVEQVVYVCGREEKSLGLGTTVCVLYGRGNGSERKERLWMVVELRRPRVYRM